MTRVRLVWDDLGAGWRNQLALRAVKREVCVAAVVHLDVRERECNAE